jgi:hypothetical protein
MIPGEVMEAATQLQELAEKNGVSLEELCVYALGTEEQQAELEASAVTPEKDLSDELGIDEDLVGERDHPGMKLIVMPLIQ